MLLDKFWRRFRRFIGFPKSYRITILEDMPDELEAETLYLIGEEREFWFAVMMCPCGCNAKIQLSLLQNDTPKWEVRLHKNNTASLHPSVWKNVGCESHFWLKKGMVRWCVRRQC